MSSTVTVWKVNTDKTLEQLSETLYKVNSKESIPEWGGDGPQSQIAKYNQKEGEANTLHSIDIGTETYAGISFNISVERKKRKDNWYNEAGNLKERRDRLTSYQSDMIIYQSGNEILLIAFAAKTTVQKIVKHTFEEKGIFTIVEQPLMITEDMFYWLLKSLRDYPGQQLHRTVDIIPTGLWSYLGKTTDGNNSIRAEGQRILAVLGTLAVIFSSEELKAVKPEFQKDGQVVVVEINLNNSLKIDDSYCMGSYFNIYQGEEQVQQRLDVIALFIINVIIPQLKQAYDKCINDNIWSKQLKIDFISSMGAEIKRRVELELESLNQPEDEDFELVD